MSTLPAPFPVEIDPVNPGRNLNTGNTPGTPIGAFTFGGALYDFLYTYLPNAAPTMFAVECLKSLDGGNTWQIQDAANEPPQAFGAGYLDVANSKVTFFTAVSGIGHSFQIQDFNLITGTWGAPYTGTGSNPSDIGPIFGAYLRPDGTRAVLYQSTVNSAIRCAVLTQANVWLPTFQVNAAGLDAFACMDSTGRLHVCFAVNGAGVPQCYQAINPDNSLGQFHQFTTFPGLYLGTPAVVGNFIVVPTTEGPSPGPPPSYNPVCGTVWIGTPLDNPVWTQSDSIFPTADGLDQVQNFTSAPMLYFDGKQTLYAIAVVMSRQWASILGSPSLLQISRTNNLQNPAIGWYDYSVYSRPGTVLHGGNNESLLRVTIGGDAIFVTVDAQDLNAAASEFSLFLPLAPTQIKITLRGVKRRRCTT